MKLVSVKLAPEVWEHDDPATELIPVHSPTALIPAVSTLLPGPATELDPPPVVVKHPKTRVPWGHLGWVAVLAYTLGVVQGSLIGRYL